MAKNDKVIGIGSPVESFVNDFFSQLKKGLDKQGLILCSQSEAHTIMDLNAVATGETKVGGGVKIWNIISGEAGKSNSETNGQRISVYVKQKSEVDKEEEKARIEIAKAKQNYSTQIALKGDG